jgi:hypothetical protein
MSIIPVRGVHFFVLFLLFLAEQVFIRRVVGLRVAREGHLRGWKMELIPPALSQHVVLSIVPYLCSTYSETGG